MREVCPLCGALLSKHPSQRGKWYCKCSSEQDPSPPADLQTPAEGERVGTVEPTFGSWQPIETAPKDGTQLLTYWPGNEPHEGVVCTGRWDDYDERWDFDAEGWSDEDYAEIPQPTHWMPMPLPPEDKLSELIRGELV